MGGHLAVPLKTRKHPAIMASKKAFSSAIHEHRFEDAARIVFKTTLEVLGVDGLMDALDQASELPPHKWGGFREEATGSPDSV